jgi:arylsulfatase A-like enzyme
LKAAKTFIMGILLTLAVVIIARPQTPRRPNVIVIITDDQGYGDLGIHGNDKIRTPNLDRLGRESVQLTQFHVMPVCAPTRACLLTGRYNYRTGVVDTFLGRALMYPDEVTLAEMLRDAGYHTGIFGKWHLGDNTPLRAIDQGFQEALVCTGGGLTQPSDPEGNTYFDPILFRNGNAEKQKGYCSDIFTNAAMKFIEQNRSRRFFCYLPFNAPHAPLQIDEKYVAPYKAMGLDDTTAKVYGMVTNVDENVGRLMDKLRQLKLDENTIVIFLTDNGPQQARYNAGMRGLKGSVYEGGIRVPCFVRWSGTLKPNKVDRSAAHVDITPTLLEICGVRNPAGVKFDGISLLPLLRGDTVEWVDRTLYFQWHRGDQPEPFRASAARSQRWKLVDGKDLYDMMDDPAEMKNVAAEHPDIVAQMRKGYEEWFRNVSSTRGYDPPPIVLGSRQENPVTLTRQDWRGPRASWNPDGLGHWEVEVAQAGTYKITLTLWQDKTPCAARFKLGDVSWHQSVKQGAPECAFERVHLKAGKTRLEAWMEPQGQTVGVKYVRVERVH